MLLAHAHSAALPAPLRPETGRGRKRKMGRVARLLLRF
jgi:hypothetical protein